MSQSHKNRLLILVLSFLCCFPSQNTGAIPLVLAPVPIVVPPMIVTATKAGLATLTFTGLAFSFFFKKEKPQPCSCKNCTKQTIESNSRCNCGCGCNFTCGCTCGCGCDKINNKLNTLHDTKPPDISPQQKKYNFTEVTKKHMQDPNRMIPVQTLHEIIKSPKVITPDPKGTNAHMYYSHMWKNGQLYNVEVLYDSNTQTILHFLYRRKSLGPLPSVQ